MKHFSIVFPLTAMVFCMGLSLVTYPHKVNRGIASVEQSYYSSGFRYNDARYKL